MVAAEMTVHVHQPRLAQYVRDALLTQEDLYNLRELLMQTKALTISASKVDDEGVCAEVVEGCPGNVWVRDHIYVALALYTSDTDGSGCEAASRILRNVAKYFMKCASKFDDAIHGTRRERAAKSCVRFDTTFSEFGSDKEEGWSDKQNAALGQFIWLRCRLCHEGKMKMTGNHLRLLGLMFDYLASIQYWADETSDWEESAERVQASSIGAVLAGVREFRQVLQTFPGMMAPIDDEVLDLLEEKGQLALNDALPKDAVQAQDADSELIFLIHPLDIVPADTARIIVQGVTDKLMGPIGVRRYIGDPYWCKDFAPPRSPSRSGTMSPTQRDQPVQEGEEAQWTVFDPILSAIYGRFYAESHDFEDLKRQQLHLGRSLAHITGEDCQYGAWMFPESYYLRNRRWVATDTCPHLWTQAALDIAISKMRESLTLSSKEVKSELARLDQWSEGAIELDHFISVLTKLDTSLMAEDLKPVLEKHMAAGGKISFKEFVDELFSGSGAPPA